MSRIDDFLQAADRANTTRSYAAAIRHFELDWKGLLPTTSDAVANYLAAYGDSHAISTLRQRLAALSRWHAEQGFADPTRSPLVRKVLKGIRAVRPASEKRARPLQLEQLESVDLWLRQAIAGAKERQDHPALLRLTRDRSMLLLGFWRGFRSDELVRLAVEDVEAVENEGMSCNFRQSKADRNLDGRSFNCPALSRLCPVAAYLDWVALSGLSAGPVYRRIDRWGHINESGMYSTSVNAWLRGLFASAGLDQAEQFSSHSLRRGFAGWARASGWDLKDLMEYVGWKDVSSALRYLETPAAGLKQQFEKGLASPQGPLSPAAAAPPLAAARDAAARPSAQQAIVRVTLNLSRMNRHGRGLGRAQRFIEKSCLERFSMQRLDKEGKRFELTVSYGARDELDDAMYALLDDMYRIAGDCECLLEANLVEPSTKTSWE